MYSEKNAHRFQTGRALPMKVITRRTCIQGGKNTNTELPLPEDRSDALGLLRVLSFKVQNEVL